MDRKIALIGFGEAGRTFAAAGDWCAQAQVIDIRSDDEMRAAYAEHEVTGCETLAQALAGADIILSLVTADQAAPVAQSAAQAIAAGALFCDMNSVSPGRKRANAEIINAAGGRYVDVAVMAPVHPAALNVPLLLSGPTAQDAAAALASLGFVKIQICGDTIGAASATKMVRSVMIKGIEALTAEMIMAADAAGVKDGVLASLGGDWAEKADYNLDRMLAHGTRRAAEMEEVAQTLRELGLEPKMTAGTVQRQRDMGRLLAGDAMPEGLDDKLQLLRDRHPERCSGSRTPTEPAA
jgi:3-hydroxyisobutyrate dehydrogenase-like beta-hydroxyacid dehydrogenase